MEPFSRWEPLAARRRLEKGEDLRLIDIRERWEWDLARIEGADLRPLSEIRWWEHRFAAEKGPFVLFCHHGIRSAYACAYLARVGVRNLVNLEGGIDRWAREVDPTVALY